MWIIPPNVLLSWPAPNYVDPVKRGPELWIVNSIFLFLATFCVAVRLYSRIFVRHWFGPDDALIILAWLASLAVSASVAVGNAKYDWNRHSYDIPFLHVGPIQTLYFAKIFWGFASSCVRLSIICLYYRLVKRCHAPPHFRYILHALFAFTSALLVVYLFTGILPCLPVAVYWHWPTPPIQNCINEGAVMMTSAVLNTASEFVIAILPVIAVFRLNVDPRQRWTVIGLLSLGFLVTLAGCFRTYTVWRSVESYDLAWWSTPHWMCSGIEIDLALISACAAPLRPVLGRTFQRLKGSPPSQPTVEPKQQELSIRAASSSQIARAALDKDDYASWVSLVYQSIDLEGLEDDGLGYTVTITGPPRRNVFGKRRNRNSENAGHLENQGTTKPSTEQKGADPTMEIERETSFSVSETFHNPALRKKNSRWESLSPAPSNLEIDAAVELAGAGAMDWSLLEEPEPITALPH